MSQRPGAASRTTTSTPSTNCPRVHAEETATDFNHSQSDGRCSKQQHQAELVSTGGLVVTHCVCSVHDSFSLTPPNVGRRSSLDGSAENVHCFSTWRLLSITDMRAKLCEERLLPARRRRRNPSVCAANQTHFLLGSAELPGDRSAATADGG